MSPRFNRLYCARTSAKYIHYLRQTRLAPGELQDVFNRERYYERFLAGEFIACLYRETLPSSVDEPPGCRSLMVYYLDLNGDRICLVHFYLRPDGSIGGAPPFRPDPKMLIHDAVRYDIGTTI